MSFKHTESMRPGPVLRNITNRPPGNRENKRKYKKKITKILGVKQIIKKDISNPEVIYMGEL